MNALWLMELGREGARNLLRHKLRSTLTLLGVVFGVGAVITMLGIGEGAQRTVLKEIEGLGLGNILLTSTQPPDARTKPSGKGSITLFRYGITQRDVDRFTAAFPSARVLVAHLVKQKVYSRSERLDAAVLGVTPDYFLGFRTEWLQGRGLSALDEERRHQVAVLTESAAAGVHILGGALGRRVKVGPDLYEVVGIVRIPAQAAGATVFIPFSTARSLYGATSIKREAGSIQFTKTEVGQVILQFPDENQVLEAAGVVDRALREAHPNLDFTATVPLDLLRSKQRTQQILNLVLIAIAAISLLIGGIGIMNIMLAIVTERIPEIGTRRALGATARDILWQFLTETVVLSTAGGILGCLLGFLAVPLASRWTGWPGVITPGSVFVSLAVAWLVGVTFGIAPAVKASRMNPVECLRYE